MQKKLIALALASLAGTAFAQSNVTVYGVADGTFDNVRVGGNNLPSTNRVSANSSYVGFKGAEDLGNGMKAVFQYEIGVGFDSAAALSTSRDSFVGVAGGFGTVVLGNLTGPTRALGAALDVNSGATGIGANSGILGKFGGLLQGVTTNAAGNVVTTGGAVAANGSAAAAAGIAGVCGRSQTCTSPFDARWKNAVAYVSPNFSGFNATVAYVANENHSDVAGAAINTSGYDLGLKYENGPIMAGLTYNAVTVKNTAAVAGFTDIKTNDIRLGASYNFGVASVRAVYDRVQLKGNGAPNVSEHQNVWGLGGTFNVTPAGKVVAQYYRANDISGNGNNDTGAVLWTVGYEHSLSKRTIVKANYASLKSDNATAVGYDFGVNSSGAAVAGQTARGFQVGVRHSF